MHLKISRRSPTVAVLLVVGLMVCVTQAAQEFEHSHHFDADGYVEDIEEETDGDEEIVYESPDFDREDFHFVDHFDDIEKSRKKWIISQAKKDDTAEEIAKYDGVWKWEAPQRIVSKMDTGLVLKSKAKHAAIAARLDKVFTFKEQRPLVVQYEVTLQEGQECGGSYIKLLSAGKQTEDLTTFNDKTPYTIMFGPDKCGNDIKMHFIFRHINPINGSITEKHCRKPKDRLEEPFKDKLPHLYQLVVRPDNSFEIRIDHKLIIEGSLLTDFSPPVNPPREIDDPSDVKPVDWDEREKIPDPTAQKPSDWDDDAPPQIPDPSAVMPADWLTDEPEMIPDPSAAKPDDWDAEIDGEWEAPLVDNPVCEKAVGCGQWKAPLITNQEYKGKWRAPLIDNPNYQGKWAPRKIENPDFFEDLSPFRMTPINAIGIELWSMSSDILFDNLIITDDVVVADAFAAQSFDIKREYIDKESDSFMKKLTTFADENPWAWKIALVLLVAAVAFNLYRITTKKDTASVAKKTDEPQPDDTENEAGAGDANVAAQGDERSSPQAASSPKKKKKSDLDVRADEYESVLLKEREKLIDSDADAADADDNDVDVNDAAADIGEVGAQTEESNAKTTRKRQVRKD